MLLCAAGDRNSAEALEVTTEIEVADNSWEQVPAVDPQAPQNPGVEPTAQMSKSSAIILIIICRNLLRCW